MGRKHRSDLDRAESLSRATELTVSASLELVKAGYQLCKLCNGLYVKRLTCPCRIHGRKKMTPAVVMELFD